MTRFALASVLLMLAACGRPDAPAVDNDATTSAGKQATADALDATDFDVKTDTQRLLLLVDEYFERSLELNPVFATFIGDHRYDDRFTNSIGPEWRAQARALEQDYLDQVLALDDSGFRGQNRLTYDAFVRNRRSALRMMEFPSHLVPVNQFFSVPNFFAQLGAGASVQPFDSEQAYRNFLGRIDGFVAWTDQAIANMREGMDAGVVQPRIVMERVLPQLAAQLVDAPAKSLFHRPVAKLPDSIDAETRAELAGLYETAIMEQIVPAYQRLHDFIRDDYLPATRGSVGIGALPDGEGWYTALAANSTTTDMTPDQIHALGLAEVERILAEMNEVREEVGFEGDLGAFFEYLKTDSQFYFDTEEALLGAYRALKDRVAERAPELFLVIPEADFEIRAVEPFRAASSAAASYQGASPDGSRPGVFYVNTYDLPSRPNYNIEAIYLHEAAPGHHFQTSIQREMEVLPRFRRFGSYTAYVEGWGLYAETLGDELGLYTDPYQRYGALSAEMLRAIRLVLDTGIHHKGWSREQALAYMRENSSMPETDAVAEVERYIAIPGQALAYKVGQLHILKLRADAERRLGPQFDLRRFHNIILGDGALPLEVLSAKVNRWIQPYL